MRKKIIAFFAIFILLIGYGVSIEKQLIGVYKDSGGPIIFPDSYIYTLLKSYRISYNPQTEELITEVTDFYQILNRAGRDRYGDYKIRFSKDKEKLKVIEADTLNKDLTIIPVEKGAINTVTPLGLQKASLYSNILDKVYSFQNLDPEDAVYIKYKSTKKSETGVISSLFVFKEDNPIREKSIKVELPSGRNLYSMKFNETKDEKIEEIKKSEQKVNIYEFKMKDLGKIKPEEYRPHDFIISPSIVFSNSKDWKGAVGKIVVKFSKNSKPDRFIKKKVKELTKKAKSKFEKAVEIYKFVSKEIKGVPLPLGMDGYIPHKASEVLKNGYGDIRDKSVLLISMLRAIGLKPFPIMIVNGHKAIKKLVVFNQFSYILVYVKIDGKDYYLDPKGEYKIFGYTGLADGTDGLFLGKDIRWIKVKNNVENYAVAEFNVNIKKDGSFETDVNLKTEGYFDSIVKRNFKLSSNDENKKYFTSVANIFNEGSESVSFIFHNLNSFSSSSNVYTKIRGRDLYIKQGNVIVLTIPDNPYFFSKFPFNLSLKDRHYPLYFGKRFRVKEVWKINTERDTKALYLPETFTVDDSDYSFKINSSKSGNQIIVEREIIIKTPILSKDKYGVFKKNYDKFNNWKLKTILLEEKR